MSIDRLCSLIERLRKETIGEPTRIPEKQAYEYQNHSATVVAVLKLIRAAHGVNAINLLCSYGLFIDFGAIIRCVNDSVEEVYFLLEEFPNTSPNVDRFVKSFFESTIDGFLSSETPPVPSNKIRSASVRLLKGRHDDATRQMMERIYKTFCGYIHANYAHIMEVYNGGAQDFNLTGVLSVHQRQMHLAHVHESTTSVIHAAAFIAHTPGRNELYDDIMALDSE
jgi:hypothetical protein